VDQYHQKKQLERLLIDYFKESYPEFPKGKLTESESPDFVLNSNSRQSIGIELTRLYPGSQKTIPDVQQKQVEIREMLIIYIHDQFVELCNLKCFVKIQFADIAIKQEQIFSLSVRLTRLIIRTVEKMSFGKIDRIILSKELPVGIKSILVLTHPGLTYSVFERSHNLGIPTKLLDDIQYSIAKKDEKLKLYQKKQLNKYWLLITTDRLCQEKSVNISNLILGSTFNSAMNKVFILELFTGKVTVLIL